MGPWRAAGMAFWMAMGVGCSDRTAGPDAATVLDAAVDVPAADAGPAPDLGAPPDAPEAVDAGLPPLDYSRDDLWLCRPGLARDRCLSADLTATELHADGTRATLDAPAPATSPAYDCFYIYPTVDVTGPAGNHTDLSNVDPMLDPLLNQAAWFRSQCRVVAPLYRQATLLGLNGAGAAGRETVAFNDVAAAFRAYLQRDNNGRPFVLMGHSQGSFMAERLLTSVILPDAALRAKLIVALLLGGSVQVPIGTTTNGTLGAFPLCTSDDQTGCALAWHTFGFDHGPTPGGVYPMSLLPGDEAACTNPVALAHGASDTRVRAVYFPTFAHQALFSVGVTFTPAVTTPFVVYRDFYSLGCTSNASFRSYLALHAQPAAGDTRTDPIPYGGLLFAPSFLGLHLLDYNVAIEDLMALVARKAARFANAS